jgi:hypothetical protein
MASDASRREEREVVTEVHAGAADPVDDAAGALGGTDLEDVFTAISLIMGLLWV